MKKRLISMSAVILIIALLMSCIIAYANTDETIYVNLTKADKNGIGYGIGDPSSTGAGEHIWNLTNYNSNNINDIAEQRNLYCIKANYGDKWNTDKDTIIAYNLSYDFQDDRSMLVEKFANGSAEINGIMNALLDATPETGYYRELLWILDNAYIEGKTDKIAFLENIGFKYDSEEELYFYEPVEGYDYSEIIADSSKVDGYLEEHLITDADIKAVQRAAIWYFTNYKIDDDEFFDKTDDVDWLNITTDGGTNYIQLAQISHPYTAEGVSRNDQAQVLYNYLIDAASKNAYLYTSENGYKLSNNVSVNTTDLPQTTTGEYILKTTRVGENYVVGPIIINKNNDSLYEILIDVTKQKGADVQYTFTDAQGNSLGITDIKELVGKTDGFYITVPRSGIENVNVQIEIKNQVTNKTLWLEGNEENGNIQPNPEQPIVEITREPDTDTIKFVSEPEEFDLALRKYITAVYDKNGNAKTVQNPRNLNNITLDTLETGTTATYKHRKDPVLVEENDEVIYTIRIYNEGNKAGYATKIIDQLPVGLIMSNDTTTVVSKDKNGNNKNTYSLTNSTLLTTTNQIILDIVNTAENPAKDIQAYTTGNLDFETIEVKCKVIQEPDTVNDMILTNVAWIAAAFDSESQTEILTKGQDRDSEPQTLPKVENSNVNKSNMENYKGITTNPNDLTNDNYFYEGQQDDDDFEKLILKAVPKKFDLALFKHIAAISKDQIIENGEYVTDTKNIDGKYLRAPEVQAIDVETGKITYKTHNKEPLTVEPGDYVLYTIRVYNEGEVDGYVNQIKDALPIGLDFVVENEEYNGIWTLQPILDSEGRQVVTTDWYGEGKGAEENEPKANLLKALNKEAAISNENPDYIDAQVLCIVRDDASKVNPLVNFAQISADSDDDVDSIPDEWNDEDDEDIEKIILQYFDLSLRKYITSVNGKEITNSREPNVNVSNLVNGTGTTSEYTHPKTPVAVEIGDKVIYTIRVYNEGDINGFASEVKDYLPPYLTYVEDSEVNKQYGWQISENGRIATTTYLANSELTAFNGTNLDFADLKIECIVSENAPIKHVITNIAEISEYKYNGNTVSNDIDSASDNMVSNNYLPTDENLPTYKDDEINKSYVPGNEDDDDFEKIYVKTLDLSLRKFVTAVNQESLGRAREPKVDVTPLKDGTGTTAIYKHPKTPVSMKIGDIVTYTIRIYNEGEASGYANEVKDYLPPYLEYVKDSEINKKYGWNISEDGRVATTTYLSDKIITGFNGTELDYEDIQIECKISNQAKVNKNITNIAEISEYKYGETILPEDIDSESDNIDENLPEDEKLPNYKEEQEKDEYVPGNEDDDDFEKIYVKEFDLALRKFITQVQDEAITTRVPEVKIENGIISYNHTKEPITLHVGDVVTYTLRIYNEGELAGYASEITDDIPEYLEYLPTNGINVEYMWTMYDEQGNITENVEEAVKVKTTYLSKENGDDNLIPEFDGITLSYKDIKIAFKVKDPNSNTQIITNYAQISDDTDENGMSVEDKDSKPDEWNEGEDDQDIENVKVEYFDLSLLKFVSKVIIIEDGKEKITETGYNGHENPEPVVKVELHKKKLNQVVVKFGYGITITNEGDIPGYATEITDYVPEGLRFEASDNPLWTDEGNNVISTKQLENTLLQPGESKTIEVIFTWINGPDNLSLKTNTAEISEDNNEYDVPDRDSTPDNKVDGEDDIDIAEVILTIITGTAKTYFTLAIGLLAVVVIGIALIKKFVM